MTPLGAGSAVILCVSLQRNPPGEVELKGTMWFRCTVKAAPDRGKVTPPSVDLDHITWLGELVGLGPPQHIPRCQATTTLPLGSMAAEGYSLWFWPSWNSLEATRGTKGLQVWPPSLVALRPTVL